MTLQEYLLHRPDIPISKITIQLDKELLCLHKMKIKSEYTKQDLTDMAHQYKQIDFILNRLSEKLNAATISPTTTNKK